MIQKDTEKMIHLNWKTLFHPLNYSFLEEFYVPIIPWWTMIPCTLRKRDLNLWTTFHTYKNICVLVLLLVKIWSKTQTSTNVVLILVQFTVNVAQKPMERLGKCVSPIATLVYNARFLLNFFKNSSWHILLKLSTEG